METNLGKIKLVWRVRFGGLIYVKAVQFTSKSYMTVVVGRRHVWFQW